MYGVKQISTSTAGEKGGPRNRGDGGHGRGRGSSSGPIRGGNGGGGGGAGGNRGGFQNRYNPYSLPPTNQHYQQPPGYRSEYERYFEKRPLNEMERRLLNVLLRRQDDFDGPRMTQAQNVPWDPYNRPPPDAYKRGSEG